MHLHPPSSGARAHTGEEASPLGVEDGCRTAVTAVDDRLVDRQDHRPRRPHPLDRDPDEPVPIGDQLLLAPDVAVPLRAIRPCRSPSYSMTVRYAHSSRSTLPTGRPRARTTGFTSGSGSPARTTAGRSLVSCTESTRARTSAAARRAAREPRPEVAEAAVTRASGVVRPSRTSQSPAATSSTRSRCSAAATKASAAARAGRPSTVPGRSAADVRRTRTSGRRTGCGCVVTNHSGSVSPTSTPRSRRAVSPSAAAPGGRTRRAAATRLCSSGGSPVGR